MTALRGAAARTAEDWLAVPAERARDLAALLDAALGHHRAHGDGPCPVCGSSGALTSAWHAATEQHRDRLRAEATAVDEATAAATAAVTRSHALVRPIPQQLATVSSGDPAAGRGRRRGLAELGRRTGSRRRRPHGGEGLTALASRLEGDHGPRPTAITVLAGRPLPNWPAAMTSGRRWPRARARCDAPRCGPGRGAPRSRTRGRQAVARPGGPRSSVASASRRWRTSPEHLGRLAPGEQRRPSRVPAHGNEHPRQLELDVTVDGEPGSALGVMSQGEVNALALSIFLPRATIAGSPFRFLVVDEPVQAMDPAKVDGLAKVLAKVAAPPPGHLFTHDNRLAAAIRACRYRPPS